MIDDIEDIVELEDAARVPHTEIVRKRYRSDLDRNKEAPSENIPHTQKVYIKTWGCSHNNSDGEYMAGQLASVGYTITNDEKDADLWLLNSCTVKNPSQDTFINAVNAGNEPSFDKLVLSSGCCLVISYLRSIFNCISLGKSEGKPVVVAGCVPQGQPNHTGYEDLSVIGVGQIDRVVEVVDQALQGNVVRLLGQSSKKAGAQLNLPKIRRNKYVEIIPINSGCLNQCTYCKTKHARGNLRSYPVEEIVSRVRQVVSEGVVEIWFTSEDTGTYGRDIGSSLPELLWAVVKELPDGVMLRVGMTNPPYILEHLEEMVKIFLHPRVYAFLHVPVQACSDRVLEDMRRQYTCDDFRQVVDILLENVPGMTIATDVICGFPTETKEDWEKTVQVMKEYKFPVLHISQFYPRYGTPAARMKRIPTKEVKRRSRELHHVFHSYQTHQDQVGEVYRCLVTDIAHDKHSLVAHNKAYEQVLLEPVEGLMGKTVDVRITSVGKHYLKGQVVEGSLEKAPKRPDPIDGLMGAEVKLHDHRNDKDKKGKEAQDSGDCSSGQCGCGNQGGGCVDEAGGDCEGNSEGCGMEDCCSLPSKSNNEHTTKDRNTNATNAANSVADCSNSQEANNQNMLRNGLIVVLIALILTLFLRIQG